MTIKAVSLYKDVPGLSEEKTDWIVPDGETWLVRRFSGSAAYLDDTVVCVVWDPAGAGDILSCTHGDAVHDVNTEVLGDGTKVIRLALTNDTNAARIMGGSWEAKKI